MADPARGGFTSVGAVACRTARSTARLDRAEPARRQRLLLRQQAPARSFVEVAQIEALLRAARLLDREQRKLEWRDVRAIRASDERATRLASRSIIARSEGCAIGIADPTASRPKADGGRAGGAEAAPKTGTGGSVAFVPRVGDDRRTPRRRDRPLVAGSHNPQSEVDA
jgi:hypothetical protein